MHLTLTDTEEIRTRRIIGGKSICVIVRVVVADPSEIPLTAIEDEVERCAVCADGEWEIQNHALLGWFSATDKASLVDDIAGWLNDQGVSVVDTIIRAYELGEVVP